MIAGLSWVDWAFAAVALLSVALGAWRGLIFELLSLVGWVVAYFCAAWAAPWVAPHLPIGAPGSALNQSAALLLGFVVVIVAWGLMAQLVRWLIALSPLTVPDRLLGAVFGALRALLVLLLVGTVVELTPASRAPEWRASHAAMGVRIVIQGLKPVLPPEVGRWLPA